MASRNNKPLKLGEGLTSKIIASRKPLIMNNEADRQTHHVGAKIVGRPALSYLCVPISVGDTCLGVISVQSTRIEGLYDADDERLLSTIAANVGVALQNVQLFNETQEALATRRPRPTSCASSAARRPTCSRCSTPSWTPPCGCWRATTPACCAARAARFHGRRGDSAAARRSDANGHAHRSRTPTCLRASSSKRRCCTSGLVGGRALGAGPASLERFGVKSSLMLAAPARERVPRRADLHALQGECAFTDKEIALAKSFVTRP
jgi:hypothetical protein